MSGTIVELLDSLPAAELHDLISSTLKGRPSLRRETREVLDFALDAATEINGFRKSHSAPINLLLPEALAACVEARMLPLAVSMVQAWGELHRADTDAAIELTRRKGLEPSRQETLGKPLVDWEPGQLSSMVAELLRCRPGLTQRQASLLICACAGRFADLGALEPLPEPTAPEPGLAGPLPPHWRRVVDDARALPHDAPEWTAIDALAAALREVASVKAYEAETEQDASLLARALTKLDAAPPAVIPFFDLAPVVAAWSSPDASWRSACQAAAAMGNVASILAEAEPLLRPARTLAERRKQDDELQALEKRLRAAVSAVDLLRKAGPGPVAGDPPKIDEPAPPAVVDAGPEEAPQVAVGLEPVQTQASQGLPAEVAVTDEAPVSVPTPPADVSPPQAAEDSETPPRSEPAPSSPDVAPEPLPGAGGVEPGTQAASEGMGTAAAPPPLLPGPELPSNLRSYGEYASTYWIAPSGKREETPWRAEGFVARIELAVSAAMAPHRLLELWVLTRALGELGAAPQAAAHTVSALAELLAAPRSPTSGSFPDRSSWLREAEAVPGHWRRMELFLEAVRPSRETPLIYERAKVLVEGAGYRDTPLRNTVLALLKLGSMGIDPVPRLLAALASDAAAAEHSPARLDELRSQFHKEVVPLWNAAGAKLPRKHCRDAWTRFIDQVEPTLRTLFPVSKGGAVEWDTVEARRSIGALVRIHEEIADNAAARFDDRSKMDKAARRIADLAMGVNTAAEELRSRGHGNGQDSIPVEALRALVAGKALEHADEELCRQVLIALASGTPGAAPLSITLRHLLRYPDLLSALHAIALEAATGLDASVAGLDAVLDPLRSAAVLLSSPLEVAVEGTPPVRQLLRLLAVPHRRWLHSRLGAGAGQVVPKTARLDDEVALFEEIDRLQASWSVLDELASRAREQVRGVLKEVRERAAQPVPDFDPTLCQEWLRAVTRFADESKDVLLAHLRSRAKAEQRDAADQALNEGRLGDAMHLLQEGPREASTELALRETTWRGEAKARYPNPLEAIVREPGDLFEKWRRGITGNVVGADRQLRGLFVDQVVEGADKKWNQTKEHLIPSAELRQLLRPYNPTYLPQLARFGSLCILVAPTNPKQSNFEHATAAVIDKLGKENLYAVLAPLLSEPGRQATLKEFRRRGLAAAIIDDLDLCRILNLGGRRPSALVALLEIVLEQQAWSTHFVPFAMHDGQHVQVEMYVGRNVEAGQLTQTPAYSRLFSGRKLGKSALLRYVHDTRDGLKLPSGNTLRVLFVPAVGAESDLDIVGRFYEGLGERFGFKVPGLVLDGNPGDALVQIAKRFIEAHPKESLLVVFDEADKFVEAQLEAYDREKEGCLSFRMRTQVESFRDEAKLPRIRFVFAGYRATSTSDGAWANWGDVLRLKPLSLDEGARLIAGPLARMGIDASAQATTIAHRCGCQPVVLLRFGELLLKHLEGRYAPTQRDHVVVTAADVAAVFNEEPVREEIRVVVRNNFQDSPRARVVFSALLGVFAQHAPGDGIPEADRLVTERLRAIDGDLAWLHPAPEAQILEVQRLLKDFAARELVLIRRGADGQPACYLRFPHHLTILLPEDPEGAIRADIAALRRRHHGVAVEPPRALVTARELDLLRDAVCRPPDPHFRIGAAIVGSHWPAAVMHRSGGFADRLGIPPDAVYSTTKADRGLDRDRLAVVNATPEAIQRIAGKRATVEPAPLFLGGADALRWALGRQLETDEMFEIIGLGRLAGPTLDWWFGKVRALSFEDLDWRERVLRATSGIPLLLAAIERALLGDTEGGVEIDRAKLEQALLATAASEPGLGVSLAGNDPAVSLAKRELEVLRMLAHVGAKTGFNAPRPNEDLTELWDELYRPTLDLPSIDPTNRGDRVAVAVLVALGLAATGAVDRDEDPLRRLAIPPKDDAIYRLAAALQP